MAEGDRPTGPATGGPQPPGTEAGSDEGSVHTFLIADVRGYTSFSQEHGDEVAGRLAAHFADVTTEIIEANGGSVLELRGDEALCIFSTTRRAIRSAIDLQARFLAETERDPSLPLAVGIGIDTGEAVPVAGGFRGRALNLAARLCSSARAGEILATREALHMAGQMDGVHVEDRGASSFKGIPEPVGVMRLTGDGDDTARWFTEHVPSRRDRPKGTSTGRRLLIGGIATVLVSAIVTPLILRHGSISTSIEPNSVGVLDAQNGNVTGTIDLPSRPGAIVAAAGSVWIAHPDAGSISRIDPSSEAILDTVPVGEDPSAMAAGFAAVWVVESGAPTLSRISPATNSIVKTIDVGNGPTGVTVGAGSVWVTNRFDGTVSRIDPNIDKVVDVIPVGLEPRGIASGFDSIWVSLSGSDSVVRIDPRTDSVGAPIVVGNGPNALTAARDGVWVTTALGDTVSEISPSMNSVLRTIPVGRAPVGVTVVGGIVWVANEADGTLSRIVAGRSQEIATASTPQGLADVGGSLWVTVRGIATAHRGGTLRLVSEDEPPSLDPSANVYAFPVGLPSLLGDALVGFNKVGGSDGVTLVPDLATALASPTDDGRTYSFTVRSDVRYSSGDTLVPADFRRGIERSFRLTDGYVAVHYGALIGGDACGRQPETCDLRRAIQVDDEAGTIVFHLRTPDPEFLYELALPFAYPVPPAVPDHERAMAGVPGTGPYMLEAPRTRQGLALVRNPYFDVWSPSAQPDGNVERIEWTFGMDPSEQVDAVAAGDADVAMDAINAPGFRHLFVRFPGQMHSTLQAETTFVVLNNAVPPFDDVRVRRALNYAIDRRRVDQILGGDEVVQPTCQQLPPNFPGYVAYCPYSVQPNTRGTWTGPDVATARRLVRASDTEGMKVTLEYYCCWSPFARYLVSVLRTIGYRASSREITVNAFYAGDRFQMRGGDGWTLDYPAASNFFVGFFTCHAASTSTFSAGFCDPAIDAMIERATEVQAEDPSTAGALWAAIDRKIVDQAPYLWLVNYSDVAFVSTRVGNYQRHPLWGVMLGQLWVN